MNDTVVDAPVAPSPTPEVEPVATSQVVSAEATTAGAATDSPPSPEDKAVAAFDRHLEKIQGKSPEAAPEAETEQPETPEPEAPEVVKEPEAKADDLSQLESENNVSFPNRPEWKAVETALKDVPKPQKEVVLKQVRGLMERTNAVTKQLDAVKPDVEAVAELIRECGGTRQGFDNYRQFTKTFNADPGSAVPMLKTLLADAEKRAGLVIQSPDLLTEAQKVDKAVQEGEISPEQAAQRRKELTELETHRAATKRTTDQTEQAKREQQQRASRESEAAVLAEMDTTEATWTAAKAKADPDFSKVQTLFNKYAQLEAIEFNSTNKRLPNANEAKQILEKAYKDAKEQALSFQPRSRKASDPVRDLGASRTNQAEPVTPFEKFSRRLDNAAKR